MTALTVPAQRYSELVPGYQLPSYRVAAQQPKEGDAPRASEHYQKVGYRATPLWGPNIWGFTSSMFRQYFGSAWVASGRSSIEFKKPMFPDQDIVIQAVVTNRTDEGVDFDLWIDNHEGTRCAGGAAYFPFTDSAPQPAHGAYVVPDDFVNTQTWERGALPIGIPHTPVILHIDEQMNRESLATTREEDVAIYRNLVHPRLFLAESFKLKTERPKTDAPQAQRHGGIHVGSETVSYLPAPVGRDYRFYGTYIDSFETSKGDQWGRKEVQVLDEEGRVVFSTINKFIFNPAAYRKPEDKASS
jgi:hypothetical protein